MPDFKTEYWENILRYLCEGSRFLIYVQRDGQPLVHIGGHRIQDLPGFASIYGRSSGGQVEASQHAGNHCDDIQEHEKIYGVEEEVGYLRKKRQAPLEYVENELFKQAVKSAQHWENLETTKTALAKKR